LWIPPGFGAVRSAMQVASCKQCNAPDGALQGNANRVATVEISNGVYPGAGDVRILYDDFSVGSGDNSGFA
jgi:hypothetical protein